MAALGAVLVLLLLTAPDVLLVIFAGLLFAVFFSAGGDPLGRRLGIGRGWGIGLFILLVVLALAGAFLAFAPAAIEQIDQLTQEIPEAVENVRSRIEEYAWGERLLEQGTPGRFVSEGGGDVAATAVVSTFGALGSFVVMLFVGLYVALAPDLYRRGVVALLAPSARESGNEVLSKAADTLRNWLVAQLMAMAVVGVLTWLGLWLMAYRSPPSWDFSPRSLPACRTLVPFSRLSRRSSWRPRTGRRKCSWWSACTPRCRRSRATSSPRRSSRSGYRCRLRSSSRCSC